MDQTAKTNDRLIDEAAIDTENYPVSGLARHMIRNGREIASATIDVREMARLNEDRATWCLPTDIATALLRPMCYVENYLSDVLIDINSIRRRIMDGETSGTALVGYRQSGVDCTSFVENRFREWYSWRKYDMMEAYYRRVYAVVWGQEDKDGEEYSRHWSDIVIKVIDASHDHPYGDPFKEDEARAAKAAAETGDGGEGS